MFTSQTIQLSKQELFFSITCMIYFISWSSSNFGHYVLEWDFAEAEEGDRGLCYVCKYQPEGTKKHAAQLSAQHTKVQNLCHSSTN